MKTVVVSCRLVIVLVAKLTLMNHLQKVTSAIADTMFSSAVASRFLVMTTLIVKHVLVAIKKNVVVTKVGMVTAEGFPSSRGNEHIWNRIFL